jgi:hypothetical protein
VLGGSACDDADRQGNAVPSVVATQAAMQRMFRGLPSPPSEESFAIYRPGTSKLSCEVSGHKNPLTQRANYTLNRTCMMSPSDTR